MSYARDLVSNPNTFDEEKLMLLLRNCNYDFLKYSKRTVAYELIDRFA